MSVTLEKWDVYFEHSCKKDQEIEKLLKIINQGNITDEQMSAIKDLIYQAKDYGYWEGYDHATSYSTSV